MARIGRVAAHPVSVIVELDIVQPFVVCRVLAFGTASFTPSMMSISPALGQSEDRRVSGNVSIQMVLGGSPTVALKEARVSVY